MAQETRERVLAIAREQHYQPSIHARSLRDNRSHTIGLVVPEITNYGFAVFSHELETLCREAGVQLLISCTDENPAESVVVNNMIARRRRPDCRLLYAQRCRLSEAQRTAAGGAV